jgi:hypothetical protein
MIAICVNIGAFSEYRTLLPYKVSDCSSVGASIMQAFMNHQVTPLVAAEVCFSKLAKGIPKQKELPP